jgi:hypothetical protein
VRAHTEVQDVAPPTGVEAQWGVALGTVLGFDLLDVFVEAGLVRDVAAGKLQDALAAQRVFERLLANGTLAADKRSVAPVAGAIHVDDAGHAGGPVRLGDGRQGKRTVPRGGGGRRQRGRERVLVAQVRVAGQMADSQTALAGLRVAENRVGRASRHARFDGGAALAAASSTEKSYALSPLRGGVFVCVGGFRGAEARHQHAACNCVAKQQREEGKEVGATG